MTLSDFKAKLNWRLILVHMAACWFIFHAFRILFLLLDLPFIIAIQSNSNPELFGAERIANAALWLNLSGNIGILVAFVLSLIASKIRHWYWVNSLSAFALASLLCWYDIAWRLLKHAFDAPGELFGTLLLNVLVNGSIMLAIGLLLLFLNGVARFIDGRKQADEVNLSEP